MIKKLKNKYLVGLLLTLAPLYLNSCNCGMGLSNEDTAYYTLKLNSNNGRVIASPSPDDKGRYINGEVITLTAVPGTNYDFSSWSGDVTSTAYPLTLIMDSDKEITANFSIYEDETYYVDFQNGNDNNGGTSTIEAWQHAPGDPDATGIAATTVLNPGNKIRFRGGVVYRGQIDVTTTGTLNHPIVYDGTSWNGSRAIIDGSKQVTGWTLYSGNIYYAEIDGDVDPISLNLHEGTDTSVTGDFLWISQYPAPADEYFFEDLALEISQSDFTRYSLSDSNNSHLASANPDVYLNGAYILMWINPNRVVYRKINSFNPATNTISFNDLGTTAIYSDGRNQKYALYNSINLITGAGQYCVSDTYTAPDSSIKRRIYLWPNDPSNLETGITMSVRKYGINIGHNGFVTISGFNIRKLSGDAATNSIGIGSFSAGYIPKGHITINDNIVEHNYQGTAIYLANASQSELTNNIVRNNPTQAGIFISTGNDVKINNNIVNRCGKTSIRYYTVDHGIIMGNTVTECKGVHANGITLYIACNDVLIANNKVFDSNNPITFQDSGNLYFINNLLDAGETTNRDNICEWPLTGRGPWNYGTIAILNNTFVRSASNSAIKLGELNSNNSYYIINNISDGEISDTSVTKHHNLYTGESWKQIKSTYIYETGEFVNTDIDQIFSDPTTQDFTLEAGSPAIGAGIDLGTVFSADTFTAFDGFDYATDINGTTRTTWDLGAYTH